MGSKNRILLAILTNLILHKIRNTFTTKELYITKAKFKKVEAKHKDESYYLYGNNFQTIINGTIGICSYKKETSIINFISIVDNNIYLYLISPNNFFIYLGTFFKSDKRKILKQCNHEIEFLNNEERRRFEDFI